MHTNRNATMRRLGLTAASVTALATGLVIGGPAGATPPRTSASVSGDTLTVTGTNAGESLALRLTAGEANTLEADFGNDGSAEHRIDRSTFTSIAVLMGNGDDVFLVDQVNGAFADERLTVDGGRGADILDGGDGAEVFFGGNGNDTVDGNRGVDVGTLDNGEDTFRWDPGDGSDVVEGGNGPDTLDFRGAAGNENMSLSPNGARSLFFRDAGNIRMDMDDVERLDLPTLGGTDMVTVNDMTGTDFRQANVDLSGSAGTVTVNGTNGDDSIDVSTNGGAVVVNGLQTAIDIAGSETFDRLQINARDGNDAVDVDPAVLDRIDVAVDLGSGQI